MGGTESFALVPSLCALKPKEHTGWARAQALGEQVSASDLKRGMALIVKGRSTRSAGDLDLTPTENQAWQRG